MQIICVGKTDLRGCGGHPVYPRLVVGYPGIDAQLVPTPLPETGDAVDVPGGTEEDGVKKFWQARGRGGKEAREEEKGGSSQQTGDDCWFGKGKK